MVLQCKLISREWMVLYVQLINIGNERFHNTTNI